MTEYLNSGWEDSGGTDTTDNGKWNDAGQTSTGDTVTVQSADPFSGVYGLDCYCNGGTGDFAYMRKDVPAVSVLHVRKQFKVLTAFPAASQSYNLMMFNHNADAVAQVRLYNNAGTIILQLGYRDGATMYYTSWTPSPALELGTKYTLELRVVIHASTGEYRVWFDGTERITQTNKDSSYYGAIGLFAVGERYSSGATVHTIRIDNVIGANAYIGPPEEEEGNPTYWEPAKRASDPSTGGWGSDEAGIMWYNTTSHIFKYWNGSSIVTVNIV